MKKNRLFGMMFHYFFFRIFQGPRYLAASDPRKVVDANKTKQLTTKWGEVRGVLEIFRVHGECMVWKQIISTWQFFVTFLGCKWLSDLQIGDEKVTLNHLVGDLMNLRVVIDSKSDKSWSHRPPWLLVEDIRRIFPPGIQKKPWQKPCRDNLPTSTGERRISACHQP